MISRSPQGGFAEQAERTPNAMAVSSEDTRLTYRELDEKANRLAHRLVSAGARPGDPVAVLVEPSADVVVAMLAVLKAGAHYLPLHHADPLDRLQRILAEAGNPPLLTDELTRTSGLPSGCEIVVIDTGREPTGPADPLTGLRIHILDDLRRPVGEDETGELYIAGPRLARGHTARFAADPFTGSGQMYRTGDLVRRSRGGSVEFLGRREDHAKILTFRGRPAEAENVLATWPGLAHIAVVAKETGNLIAYIVPESGDFEVAALRANAAESLPDHLVPSAFVVLDALPLTPDGKLDHQKLPDPLPGPASSRPVLRAA